ncbi:MAG TPA: MCP four helix bundle domain-containing protein, partial [Clostridium sp.]
MKWFNNLKMLQKLVSAFVLVALFIGIVGGIGIYSMKNIDKDIDNIYNLNLIGIKDIANLKSNLLEIKVDTLLIIDSKNIKEVKNNIDDVLRLTNSDNLLITQYRSTITS